MDQLSTFYPLLFTCYKRSPRVFFNVKFFFASVTSLGTSSYFLSQLHSLFMLVSLSWLSSSDCRSVEWWQCWTPTVHCFLLLLCIFFIRISHYFLFLCITLIFIGQFPVLIIKIYKNVIQIYHWEIRRQQSYTLHCLCSDPSLTAFERNDTIGYWSWGASDVHIVTCELKDLVVKFVLYVIIYNSYTMEFEIWAMLLSDWYYLTKLW